MRNPLLPLAPLAVLATIVATAPLAAQRPTREAPRDLTTTVEAAWFDGTPVAECIDRLARHHGLNIVVKGVLGDEPVTGFFRNVPSADAAAALLEATGYTFRRAQGDVLIVEGRPAAAAAAVAAPIDEASVKPGINESFLAKDLNVDSYVQRFSGESREVFVQRARIAKALGLESGMAVADIGAGTGIYLDLFARAVGAGGKVYAVDIAEPFVARLGELAAQRGYTQVQPVLCTDRATGLAPGSVDRAFICDTYHHFEFPHHTMTSVLDALRPGGELVVVDFERIPGVSRPWLLDHVRAGRDEVCAELASFGFEFVEFVAVDGLRETWIAKFRKPR